MCSHPKLNFFIEEKNKTFGCKFHVHPKKKTVAKRPKVSNIGSHESKCQICTENESQC